MLTQAVFLVGGLGSRLKEATKTTPKPLIVTAGRPFIDYLIDEAARHGFCEILLLAGYLGQQFESHYDGLRVHGATIRVLREDQPMGTGGAVRQVLEHLEDCFLLANGDSFFDINLRALPLPEKGGLSMALRATAPGARYGTVRLEREWVRGFHCAAEGIAGPVNAGIYICTRELVVEFPAGPSSLENDHFPRLAQAGRLRGTVFDRYFIDMGVPTDLARAQCEMTTYTRRPAVFFDRDGVLNVEKNYVHTPEQFEWLPGAREAIRLCNDLGWLAFVVTNQAGVAHGHYDESAIARLHAWMAEDLSASGAHIDAFEYCPHHPEGKVARYRKVCDRRKPGPRMILDLLAQWSVDSPRSFLIGDKDSDLAAARAAGIGAHLYEGGHLAEFVSRHIRATA